MVALEKTQRAVKGWATAELVKNLVIFPFNDDLSNDTPFSQINPRKTVPLIEYLVEKIYRGD
jgi:hypothetical protein